MTTQDSTLRATVKQKYGQAALRVSEGGTEASCCGSSACCGATTEARDPITSDHYDQAEKAGLPVEAVLASLWDAAILLHSQSYDPAKRFSTSAPVVGSTFFSRRNALGRPEKRTDWT
jgi:hypothetical protein